jgi:hypothetical protein
MPAAVRSKSAKFATPDFGAGKTSPAGADRPTDQNGVIFQNGGKFQAGNSPGSASFGRFVFEPAGVDNYVFAVDDAAGTAGPAPDALGHVSGWSLVRAVPVIATATTTSPRARPRRCRFAPLRIRRPADARAPESREEGTTAERK